jgi:deoxyribodipyrimidine photolyase-related protein
MRVHLHVLMDKDGRPKGGRWSFDTENRDKYRGPRPPLPPIKEEEPSPYVKEAQRYVNTRFPSNPGSCERLRFYPTSRKAARRWLTRFCREALPHFGRFEDSITPIDHPFLFHSVLSPLLNVGLLTDVQVLEQVLRCAGSPIASIEGFIRQLIGWRQYVRWVYENHAPSIRTANALRHTHKIPLAFWEARTGMPPVDDVLQSVREWGYAHHIQRLMVIGSFLLLCRCHPAEAYNWFMVSFVDSYDVFMLPNLNCMSQWADAGRYMMKRPYFTSSAYLLKMSSYRPADSSIHGLAWTTVYDALYYLFIDDHQDLFASNYAMAASVAHWRSKDEATKKKTRSIARRYLDGIHRDDRYANN